jgi:uncharacterized membrane protein
MAGIGFELRRILQRDSLAATAEAHFLGGLIVLGPFLCSVLCLAGLNLLAAPYADFTARQGFASLVVYVYGGSLCATGPLQVLLTRYLADKLYRGEYDSLIESLFPALGISLGLLALPAIPVLLRVELSLLAKLLMFSLHATLGCLWLVVVFVRAARGHRAIAFSFLGGSAAALAFGVALVPRLGLEGLLAGYALGHVLLLVLLIRRLVYEFGHPARWDWGVLSYVRTFPSLLAIGLFQNLGVWIDKFVFWGSGLSLEIARFVTAPKYDSSTFLGFLTALPAFVVFFVRVETDFHERFHRYYDEIFFRGPYDKINAAGASLREALIRALIDILKVQAVISFLAAFFGVEILSVAGLPVSQIGMFRYAVLGSFFLAFMMFANVILLYLDRRLDVLFTSLLFCLANLGLSVLSLRLGYPFYGSGFAAASLVAMLAALAVVANQLYNLEFMTFGMMPVMGSRRATPGLLGGSKSGYGVEQPLSVQGEQGR